MEIHIGFQREGLRVMLFVVDPSMCQVTQSGHHCTDRLASSKGSMRIQICLQHAFSWVGAFVIYTPSVFGWVYLVPCFITHSSRERKGKKALYAKIRTGNICRSCDQMVQWLVQDRFFRVRTRACQRLVPVDYRLDFLILFFCHLSRDDLFSKTLKNFKLDQDLRRNSRFLNDVLGNFCATGFRVLYRIYY